MDEHIISQSPVRVAAIIPYGTPVGYNQISVSTATSLTQPQTSTNKVMIQPDNGDIRWRDDGVAPTASVGNYLSQQSTLTLDNALSIDQLQMIAVTGTVNVNCNFYMK